MKILLPKLVTLTFVVIASLTYAQTSADFNSSLTSGCSPLSVSLLDNSTSTATITDWSWTSNGSFISAAQNPSLLLTEEGAYDICLTVTASDGSSDTRCIDDFLTVFTNPIAQFNANATSGCVPLDVEFTSSSISGGAPITNLTWGLGGSCGIVNTGPADVVPCTYAAGGDFQVTLLVEDENGCTDNVVIPNFINAQSTPELNFSIAPYTNCELPMVVDYNNDGTLDPSVVYNWDFGDGQTFIGFDPPPITYNSAGPFTTTVNAVNSSTACMANYTFAEQIELTPPVTFGFTRSANCGIPEILFTNTSPVEANLLSWDFGDGNSSTLINPSHTFSDYGCYDVTLTRTLDNCTNSITQTVCIEDVTAGNVTAAFNNPESCLLPHTSNFFASGNPGLNYEWNFGDGSTSAILNTSHSYTNHGTYDVVFTISDQFGCTTEIPVGQVQAEALNVTLENAGHLGCAPAVVTENPILNIDENLVNINWEVRDENGALVDQSNLLNPSFSLNNPGCYEVMVTGESSSGCLFQETYVNAYCVGAAPGVDMTFTPTQGCANTSFSFNSIVTGDYNILGWKFIGVNPEPYVSIDPNPTHEYDTLGCFDVLLTVGNYECYTFYTEGPLCIDGPLSRFDFDVDCSSSGEVSFTSTSLMADTYHWDFGVSSLDSDTSNLEHPSFSYSTLGDYTVTLVTENFSTGCTDTTTAIVSVMDPSASFAIPSLEYCIPATINPVNNSIAATSYLWSLPDGGAIDNVNSANPQITFLEGGVYSIVLEIQDLNSCSNSFIIDNIEVSGPEIGFDYQLSDACVPFELTLNDTSSNAVGNNNSWEWNFGFGQSIGTGQNLMTNLDTSGIFNIELIVEDDRGCNDSLSQSIDLNSGAPIARFDGILSSCEAVGVQFENESLGTGLSYNWDFGNGEFSNDEHPLEQYNTGRYEVCLAVDDGVCSHVYCDSVFISDPIANFAIDQSYTSCIPSTVSFENSSINAVEYFWDFGDGSGGSTNEQGSNIYISEGFYDVTLVAFGENQNCSDTLNVMDAIELFGPQGEVEVTIDEFCLPSDLILNVENSEAYDVTVFFGDGVSETVSNVISPNFMHTYINATDGDGFVPSVILSETDNPDCFIQINTDTLELAILEVGIAADTQLLCDVNRDVLFSANINSNLPYTFEWMFQGGDPSTSVSEDVVVNFNDVGFYDVVLTIENGICQDTIEELEFIRAYDIASVSTNDYVVCFGDSVVIEALGNFEYVQWSPLNFLSSDTISNPFAFPTDDITYSVVAGFGECPMVTAEANVSVFDRPNLSIDESVSYFPATEVVIGPEDDPEGMSYQWTPPVGLSCQGCANPTYTLDSTGIYTVVYTVDSTGCSNTAQVEIQPFTQCPPLVFGIPNAFSPNDDGINDYFEVYADLIDKLNYIRILDRWGSLVFESTDIDARWDGKLGGKFVNPGVYVYIIEFVCPLNQEPVLLRGDVTLMR